MKKKLYFNRLNFKRFQRKLIVMRNTILILLFSAFQVLATGSYAQTKTISLSMKDAAIRDVLHAIQKQSEFYFLYNSELVDVAKKVDITIDEEKVDQVLTRLFSKDEVDFLIKDRYIVLTPVGGNAALLLEQQQPQRSVSGKVSDSGGVALPGVTVVVKGTTQGTVTDIEGNYTITNIPEDATLVFSFVGMRTQEIDAGNQAHINIRMEEETIGIEEVVAIGYGVQKSSRLTTAIAKVDAEKLDMSSSTLTSALIGKLSGVQVSQIRGTPGRDIDIRIRGVSSINYSLSPLYVVDGYPITGDLTSVNMNDIESIEVLKDAASAAIYGSRASNGVVLITTKRGRRGIASDIQVNASYGLQERFSKVTTFNRDEWIEWEIDRRNQNWVRQGGKISDSNEIRPQGYQINPIWIENPQSLPDNDWQDLVDRIAPIQNYQLSSSGGSESINYYISGDYVKQEGILVNSYFNRFSFKANLDVDLSKIARMGLNLHAAATERNDPDTDSWYSYAGGAGALNTSVTMPPIIDVDEQVFGNMNPWAAASMINPLLWMEETLYRTKGANFVSNLYLDLNLAPELFWKTSIGVERRVSLTEYFIKNYIARNRGSLGDVQNRFNENFLAESLFRYAINKTNWAFDIMGGGTYQSNFGSSSGMSGSGYPDEANTIPGHTALYTLNQASIMKSITSSASQWRLISFLSRANFSFLDKYIFTASIRRDGSSRFGKDNRWGWFPSVSFAWLLEEEPFAKEINWLSRAKPRISYGVVGNNNIGDYPSISSLGQTNAVMGNGKDIIIGLRPTGFSNTMLGWEQTHTVNFGLDLSVWKHRLQFSSDYYIANTKNLLMSLPIPQITGFSSSLQNVGEIQNKGIEIELNSINLNGAFGWSTFLNISHYRNKVIDIVTPIYGDAWGTVTITTIGEPIGSYYLLKKVGVFQTKEDLEKYPQFGNQNLGDSRYEDINNDGIIDEKDWSIVGSPHPDFYFGLSSVTKKTH